jgi:heme-degrading monooxygenase HmoA
MLCALTVRQLKPGTFEQFADAFRPSDTDTPPPGWVRFTMIRDTSDENRVVTFGFFDGSLEQLEGSQDAHGFADRRAAADAFVADVPVNGVFDVVVDLHAEHEAPR